MKPSLIALPLVFAGILLAACSQGGAETNNPPTPAANRTTTTAQDAVTADPSHYIVLFENDMARFTSYQVSSRSEIRDAQPSCRLRNFPCGSEVQAHNGIR